MKVLIAISDSFCSNFIKGQGKYLRDKGNDVIIVSAPGEEIDRLEIDENIRVIRVPFKREISIIDDIKCLFLIIKIIYNEKPDIINAGNPKTGFLFSISHIFFPSIPLVFTLRGIRSDTLKGIKKIIIKLTEKYTCLLSTKVLAISPSLRNHAIKIGIVHKTKCVTIGHGSSNGVNLNYYNCSSHINHESNKIRIKHKLENSFIIGFVGRVTKDKGIIETIDAFKLSIASGARMKLIIVGPIEENDPIPQEYYREINTNSNIIYLSKMIDVRPIYNLLDILVLYSHREGFGNVVLEAACYKVPSIVANIPGLCDTISNNITGILVQPKSFERLSSTILKLSKAPSSVIKMGHAAQKRVKKHFSSEIIWKKQLELYSTLVNK